MSNEVQPDAPTQLTMQATLDSASRRQWVPYANSGYLLGPSIAAGGMGSVHLGLKQGALGFRRLLAIKRLHGHLARDPEFVARFKDEIRLVSRLNHPNIVQTFDVLEIDDELALVMEYVEGVTLYQLLKDADAASERLPIDVVAGVLAQALHGLHSAHELCDVDGKPLHLVHRDVSPQNIMIAKDGLAKVLDFGVAKAASETHVTRTGQLSGKAAYMSPEQALGQSVDRRTDVFAAGIVLWEALTGQRLFRSPGMAETVALRNVLEMRVRPPSELRPDVPAALERVVLRALERDPTRRYGSARDFALALEEAVPHASLSTVASGVTVVSRQRLVELGKRAVTLPPDRAEDAAEPRPYVRPPASAFQNDITRPIEGISVEPNSQRRTSRIGLTAIAALALLGVIALVVSKGSTPSTDAPVVGAAFSDAALLSPNAEQRESALRMTPPAHLEHTSTGSERVEPVLRAAQLPTAARDSAVAGATAANANPERSVKSTLERANPVRRASSTDESTTHAVGRASKPLRTATKQTATREEPVAAKTKANCSPPTYTDAEGIRHFKPECL